MSDYTVHVDDLGRAFCGSCAGDRPLNVRRSDLGTAWPEHGIEGTYCDGCGTLLSMGERGRGMAI